MPEWRPDQASGNTWLRAYGIDAAYRRYFGSPRRRAYAEPIVGVLRLAGAGQRTGPSDDPADQHSLRLIAGAAAGYVWMPTQYVGVFGEAEYRWTGAGTGDGALSPRWIATPIRAGLTLAR
jgi:hypothetical protein